MNNCDYCGKVNESGTFFIGAKRDEDKGFTMLEGTGQMACDKCYPKALEEAKRAIARHTGLDDQGHPISRPH